MPRGIYPRNQAKKIKKAIKPLIKTAKSSRLSMSVISAQDGMVYDKFVVGSYFKAFQIILEDYNAKGIHVYEVRIGNV